MRYGDKRLICDGFMMINDVGKKNLGLNFSLFNFLCVLFFGGI